MASGWSIVLASDTRWFQDFEGSNESKHVPRALYVFPSL
jgi:hypothetical protein